MRVATRGSALALWQAEAVAASLRAAHPGLDVTLVVVDTKGDQRLDLPVWELGGQGVFVKEVQVAVLAGAADIAVHSAKDLPSEPTPELTLAAVPARADARDAMVGAALAALPPGAVVGTGSVRRRAQLAWLRPDLTFVGLRGNIATRLTRVPAGGAALVAAAALDRLGLSHLAAEVLAPSVMLPQVGQGAIGIECRSGDAGTVRLLAAIDDPASHVAVRAERAFLACLGSGCSLPVGAYATLGPASPPESATAGAVPGGSGPEPAGEALVVEGSLCLEGMIASIDGRVLLRGRRTGSADDPEALGADLAADLLQRAGGRSVLDVDGAATGRPAAAAPLATPGAGDRSG